MPTNWSSSREMRSEIIPGFRQLNYYKLVVTKEREKG